MSNYCVDCGCMRTKQKSNGEYIEVESTLDTIETIYTEVWICTTCIDDRRK